MDGRDGNEGRGKSKKDHQEKEPGRWLTFKVRQNGRATLWNGQARARKIAVFRWFAPDATLLERSVVCHRRCASKTPCRKRSNGLTGTVSVDDRGWMISSFPLRRPSSISREYARSATKNEMAIPLPSDTVFDRQPNRVCKMALGVLVFSTGRCAWSVQCPSFPKQWPVQRKGVQFLYVLLLRRVALIVWKTM